MPAGGLASSLAVPAQFGQATGATNSSTLGGPDFVPFDGFRGARGGFFGRGGGGFTQDAQLTQDPQKLRTDQAAVLSGSAVTDSQRLALRNDLRAIEQASFHLDKQALAPVVDRLLTAVTDRSYDDPATAQSIQGSFNALFAGSTVSQATIDQTYTDIVAVARNLNLSTGALNNLASDRAAIQADFTRLGIDTTGSHGPGGLSSNLDLVLAPGEGRFGGVC